VPSYNPNWAYGAWSEPAYPPAYYPPPAGYGYGATLASGLMWGLAIAGAGAALYGGWNWARGAGYVNINSNRAVNVDRNFDRNRYNTSNRWQHDAGHRRGVAYRDSAMRQQFGQSRPGADQRQQFRGQADRPQGGAGQGQRPNAGQGGQRPNAGQGGQRPNAGQGGGRPGGGQGGQQRPAPNRAANPQGDRGSALSGVNRGQQVNREAARGRAQQGRAAGHPRGGGGGARGGGGGARGGGGRR